MLLRLLQRRPIPPPAPQVDGALSPAQEFELEKRAITEVVTRTKGGFVAYPVLWVLAMQGGDVFESQRSYVLWHALGLGVVGGLRLAWALGLRQRLDANFAWSRLVFRGLMLVHGLYWGLLLAVCMTSPEQAATRQFLMPISVALVITGALMMGLDEVLGLAFPVCIVGPPVVGLLVLGDPSAPVYGIAAAIMLFYAGMMSGLFRNDYLRGERGRFLLEDRARDLELLSLTDGLTQVRNRLFIDRQLPLLWQEARRGARPLSVALIDLDHFKKINDTHGHAFGDECLRHAARVLRDELQRPQDLLARYGGEEFLVLLPDTDHDGARAVAERLRARIAARPVDMDGRQVTVTCSIGLCSTIPDTGDEGLRSLMRRADEALYKAKAQGRNRVAALRPTRTAAAPGTLLA